MPGNRREKQRMAINEQLLKKIFTTVFGLHEDQFSSRLQMGDIAAWDSVGHLNLVFAIESAFNVKFELEQIPDMTSVSKILEALERMASSRRGGM
jgi:acyl carrier protein